jgi:hypothetical protein
MPLDKWKTLAVSLAVFITGLGTTLDLPILSALGDLIQQNIGIALTLLGAIFGFLRMITNKPSAVTLVK